MRSNGDTCGHERMWPHLFPSVPIDSGQKSRFVRGCRGGLLCESRKPFDSLRSLRAGPGSRAVMMERGTGIEPV